MESTGIVRGIDDLGRIVIAKSFRKALGIQEGDPLEESIDGDKIILRKYQQSCVVCGNKEHLWESKGKMVCQDCVDRLASLARPEVRANAESPKAANA